MNDRRARRARRIDVFGAPLLASVLVFAAACGTPTVSPRPAPFEPTDNTQNPATGDDDAGVSTPSTPTPPADGDGGVADGGASGATPCEVATAEARRILEARCASCHGNGAAMGGFATVLDTAALLRERRIVADDAAASPLFRLVQAGTMPKGGPRLSVAEVESLRTWIECGPLSPGGADDAGVPPGDDAGLPPGDDDDDDDDDDADDDDDDDDDADEDVDEDVDEAADADEDLDEQQEEAGDDD